MNSNPEPPELRETIQQTVEMVERNARDNACLRGAFEQMDKRFDNLIQAINQRFEQVDQRFDDLNQSVSHRFEQIEKRFEAIEGRISGVEARISSVEGQLNTQLRSIIGLMTPIYLALIALIVKVFLGS